MENLHFIQLTAEQITNVLNDVHDDRILHQVEERKLGVTRLVDYSAPELTEELEDRGFLVLDSEDQSNIAESIVMMDVIESVRADVLMLSKAISAGDKAAQNFIIQKLIYVFSDDSEETQTQVA